MTRSTESTRSQWLAWHGWRIDVPAGCDPARLDGNADRGTILLSDLERPRLGVRWQKLKKNADIAAAVGRALHGEVGKLAAAEARPANPPGSDWQHGRAYLDPEPPGRDVWVGYSRASGRLFELIHHAQRRDNLLLDALLPTLADGDDGEWSIFDLYCRVPVGAVLAKQRLNVGDLSLEFLVGHEPLVIRQIAVASVALTRQSIGPWLISQQLARKQHYRPIEQPTEIELTIGARVLSGVCRRLVRRRRHAWQWRKPRTLLGMAAYDMARDKLFIAEAIDESAARKLIESAV